MPFKCNAQNILFSFSSFEVLQQQQQQQTQGLHNFHFKYEFLSRKYFTLNGKLEKRKNKAFHFCFSRELIKARFQMCECLTRLQLKFKEKGKSLVCFYCTPEKIGSNRNDILLDFNEIGQVYRLAGKEKKN